MRGIRVLFAATMVAFPHSVSAADLSVSCALTKEEVVFTPQSSPVGSSVRKHIAETAEFAIAESALITPMGSPCDRIAGGITNANINVSCSFPSQGISQASINIQIDRQLGTISETWDIIENDGAKAHFFKSGTCRTGEAVSHIADRSSQERERTTLIAAGTSD